MSNRLIPSLVGGLLLAIVASAAPAPGATLAAQDEGAQAQASTLPTALVPLFDGIKLTDDQLRQVTEVHQKHGAAIGAPPAKADPNDSTKPAMPADATDHRAEEAKELRALLTPDQQKIFDRNMEKVKLAWGRKPSGY